MLKKFSIILAKEFIIASLVLIASSLVERFTFWLLFALGVVADIGIIVWYAEKDNR